MRARVPAFDALEPGDLGIVPVSALAIVAPDDEAVATLIRGRGGRGDRRHRPRRGPAGPDADGDDRRGGRRRERRRAGRAGRGPGRPGPDRAQRDRLPRQPSGGARSPGDDPRVPARAGRARRRRARGDGRGDRGVPRPGDRDRGPAGARLAVHAPAGVPDAAAAVAAYHHRRRSAAARIPLPLPSPRGGPLGDEPADASGSLVLLGDRPPTELERVATARVAGLLVLELVRDGGGRAGDRHGAPRAAAGRRPAVGRPRRAAGDRRGPPPVRARPGRPARRARRRRREPRGPPPRPAGARAGPPDGAPRRRPEHRAPGRRRRPAGRPGGHGPRPPDRGLPRPPRGRLPAVLGGPGPVGRGGRCPGDDGGGGAARRAAARSPAPTGFPPIGCWATCTTCPTASARPGRCWSRSCAAAPTCVASGWRRSGPCSSSRASPRQPMRSASTATRSPTGSGAIEAATGWRLADPELRFPLALALRLVQDA